MKLVTCKNTKQFDYWLDEAENNLITEGDKKLLDELV
jgi:hypothetical protein